MNGISRAFVVARTAVLRRVDRGRPERQAFEPAGRRCWPACAAAWASVRLLPPASGRVRLVALLLLLPRFLWQSLVAGLDVARRAFAPRLDLQPGFVEYRTQLPPGSARSAFELIASLMPGSVPSDEREQVIEFHCLDLRQPVAEQLAAEERAYAKALLPGQRHG